MADITECMYFYECITIAIKDVLAMATMIFPWYQLTLIKLYQEYIMQKGENPTYAHGCRTTLRKVPYILLYLCKSYKSGKQGAIQHWLCLSSYPKMVDVVLQCWLVGEPCELGQKHLCNVQYMSIITFRRDMLQVGYSPLSLSLLYTLGCMQNSKRIY